ncbi:cytochrome P450 [Pseudomaricurvus sp.]|uniref:cytochrome P450 n=1 Tax=Pseudomaricurvus sp. TaxID=2004510 RepID=UPI003F6C7D3C
MNAPFSLSSAFNPLPEAHEIPLNQLDVSDPRLLEQNVWPAYFKRLRDESPIHYLPDSPFGPYWSITRFDDIKFVDSNWKLFSSEPVIVIGDRTEELALDMFIAMDPPKHDQQRKAVQGVVAPANLAQMEGLIRQRVGNILDNLPVGETFNWVEHVSVELTSQMLATLFGFPLEDRHKLIYWSDMATAVPEMTGGICDPEERMNAMNECAKTFYELWHQRMAEKASGESPGFDLIQLLQNNEDTKDMIERPKEFLGNLILLIVGGNDTTRNSITGGVHALNQFPAEYEKLRANHALIPNMVSEIIRWQTPLAHMRRIATEDVEMHGQIIRKGDKVVMWYLSGNRDERVIDQADQFMIDRPNARQHLSFGFGIHRCMGNRLAEMQLRILWEEIIQRFNWVEVVGEAEYVRSNFVKGFKTLPVRVHLK